MAQTPNVICLPYLFADLKLAKKLMIDVRGKLREVNEKCTAALREKMKQHIEVLETHCSSYARLLDDSIQLKVNDQLCTHIKQACESENLSSTLGCLQQLKTVWALFNFTKGTTLAKILNTTQQAELDAKITDTQGLVEIIVGALPHIKAAAEGQPLDWSCDAFRNFMRLLDLGLPSCGYITAAQHAWFPELATKMATTLRNYVVSLMETQLSSAGYTTILKAIIGDILKGDLDSVLKKDLSILKPIPSKFNLWEVGLELIFSKTLPEEKLEELDDIVFNSTTAGYAAGAAPANALNGSLVWSLAALMPYLQKVQTLQASVGHMTKSLTMNTAVTKLYDQAQAREKEVAAAKSQPKKKPNPAVACRTVYRQTHVSEIYDALLNLKELRMSFQQLKSSPTLAPLVEQLDKAASDSLSKAAKSMMGDFLHTLTSRVEAPTAADGPFQTISATLAARPADWQQQLQSVVESRAVGEFYITYTVTKSFMKAMMEIVPMTLSLACLPHFALDDAANEVLSEMRSMVDAFIAIDAGGEDKKSALQAKPLLLKLGTAMGDLILATSLIRKLKPEECSRQVVLDQAHKAFL